MLASPERGRGLKDGCNGFPIAVITGGTGIVGSALVQQLAADLPDHGIILLTRRPGKGAVYADLTHPDLALDGNVRTLLQQRASLFIHCAADTRFNLPIEQARLTNTEGTRHALNLARSCRRLTQFAHVSTLYVAGRREGLVTEEPLRHHAGYVNTYEETKHEAEDLVLRESERLPVGIYRLSSVIDESGNGGHFRQVIRFVRWRDQFTAFPADRNIPVDLISREWAARALSALIARHFTPGCIRHVCAGEANSLSVGSIMNAVFSAYEASAGSALPRPALIALSEFASFCTHLPPGSGASRALASLMTFIPHLSIAQPFDCTATADLLLKDGVPRPDIKSLLSRVLANEFRCEEVPS